MFMDHLLSHHELFLEHTVLRLMAECCMLPVVQLHHNWKQCVHHTSLWSRQLVTCGHSRLQVLRWAAKLFTINQQYSLLLLVVTRNLKKSLCKVPPSSVVFSHPIAANGFQCVCSFSVDVQTFHIVLASIFVVQLEVDKKAFAGGYLHREHCLVYSHFPYSVRGQTNTVCVVWAALWEEHPVQRPDTFLLSSLLRWLQSACQR